MNRISLYEAIRRKKENQGLNSTTPKPGSVPDQGQRTEPRVQLKQPLGQEKPVIQAKPAAKSPLIRPLSSRSSFTKKTQKSPWLKLNGILNFLKKNPMATWGAIGGLVLILVVIGMFSFPSRSKPDSVQPPAKKTVAANNDSQIPAKNVEKKTPEQKPVVAKQEEKPAPIQPKPPVVTVPVKQVEVPKLEPKAQIPVAIQTELQKKAENTQTQTAPKSTGKGDNVIVIATYTKQDDLVPVTAYFKQNGIETEIIKHGSYFQVVTKERFENPKNSGTDGYRMIQTIKRIGANYKSPSGYERFSSTPFQDVYGKKVK